MWRMVCGRERCCSYCKHPAGSPDVAELMGRVAFWRGWSSWARPGTCPALARYGDGDGYKGIVCTGRVAVRRVYFRCWCNKRVISAGCCC